jgi:hypothetical protein
VSKKERRDSEKSGGRGDADRRDTQPEQGQNSRPSEQEPQESDSLTALKGILAKVASQLKPLQITPEEAIGLVEQLYERVLEMDLKLAGEADDTRKSSVLSHIQDTVIRRENDALVVDFPQN